MMTFTKPIVPTLPYDPFKHVNYNLGMVLGVDDYSQEFSYHAGRLEYALREVVSYGTSTGLSVRIDSVTEGTTVIPQVVVGPGTAINPRGKLIHVDSIQCARLNAWLAANRLKVIEKVGSPPGPVTLYVVLCYRECPVDLRPIPGEPCRDESEMLKPSRLADDYALELTWDPPEQRSVDAMRDFVSWMRGFAIDDGLIDSDANRKAFESAIRGKVFELQSPPLSPPLSPPDYMLGSPPADVAIPRVALCDYLRTAFRIWVTDLRPLWLGKNQAIAGGIPDEQCVLLAQLDIPLTVDYEVADITQIAVIEDQRPYVLPLQLIQEWMLCGIAAAQPAALASPPAEFSPPAEPGTPVEASPPAEASPPELYSPPEFPTELQMIGDVGGTTGANTIEKLQTTPVIIDLDTLDTGMVLQYDGAAWVAALPLEPVIPPPPPPPPAPPQYIVAAGRFDAKGKAIQRPLGDLRAHAIQVAGNQLYLLEFAGMAMDRHYVVKGTVVNGLTAAPAVIEVIDYEGEDARTLNALREAIGQYNAANRTRISQEKSITVRVSGTTRQRPLQFRGFMIEISDLS